MPQTTVDLLRKGVEVNTTDGFRHENVVLLPADGEVILTGDLHGHCRNFERIVTFADLENHPERHVVLQEIIHGGPEDEDGGCLSYKLLLDAVRYKLDFPDHVHLMMGNHDTAFINSSEVMKNGKEMNRAMNLAMEREFGPHWEDVVLAMKQFLFSQPLAVKTENRIWASHSLPADRVVDTFDPEIVNRQLRINDLVRPGSGYLLTWGRNHSQQLLDRMAAVLDVDLFVLGHQRQEQGWSQAGDNLVIIASDHNHGCLLPLSLSESYTIERLVESIVPLTSIP